MPRRAGGCAKPEPWPGRRRPWLSWRTSTLSGSLPARHYSPSVDATGLPLILFFHGGRFFSGDLDITTPSAACWLLPSAPESSQSTTASRRSTIFRQPRKTPPALWSGR
ncbi:MAG: hypothetical protein QM757_42430 [Paludibaculum sp.]